MSDNPLDRIPSFGRVSFRAVVVPEGEDPGPALAAAGILDPVALPIALGEAPPDRGFGDGSTPNVTAVLAFDGQQDAGGLAADADGSGSGGLSAPAAAGSARQSGQQSANLPAAYGMQPLAPARRSGDVGRSARRAAVPPPSPDPTGFGKTPVTPAGVAPATPDRRHVAKNPS